MKNESQKGFNIIEVVIIVAVIGLMVVGGWWIYQNNRTKVSDAAGSGTQNNSSAGQGQKPDVAYLKVKEWGIQLPLSKEVNDAYYVASVSSVGKDGLPNAVFLGLKSLDSFGCTADGANHGKDSAVGAILRITPGETDEVTGNLLMDEYTNGVTVDGYYYAYQSLIKNDSCNAPLAALQASDAAFMSKGKAIAKATD